MWCVTPRIFLKNLILRTSTQLDVIIFRLFLCKKLSFELFSFELLSFLNELSYRCQIGLKWKVFWSSFWESLSGNAFQIFQIDFWTVNQLFIKIFVKKLIVFKFYVIYHQRKISLFVFLKTIVNYFKLETNLVPLALSV